jgi:hypothetical protein
MANETKDKNDGAQAQKPRRKREVIRSERFVSTYTNNVFSEVTAWDVRMRFGSIIKAAEELLTVEETVELVMSPQHAKSLYQLLGRQLQVYERLYGAIPWPTAAQDDLVEVKPGDEKSP